MFKLRSKTANKLYFGAAVLLTVATLIPALVLHRADAAQVSSRSVTMSSSALGATNVNYEVSFKAGHSMTIKGIVVEFCDNTPLEGDSCTIADNGGTVVPTITSADGSGLFTNLTGTSSISGHTWTLTRANSNHTVKLTNATGVAIAPGDANPVLFRIVASNPESTAGTSGHSFYARIYTYVNDTGAGSPASHSGGATTGTDANSDFGGIALSTAEQITITTRVMETLRFCVNKTGGSTACPGTGAPALDIGHGTPKVIDNTLVDNDTAVFGLSTNASSGATVRMRGNTLTSGGNSITPMGANAGSMSAGTERFGLNVDPGSGITADTNYAGVNQYGFDSTVTTAANGYGDRIAYTSGPINHADSTLTFAATAALTTPAGLYQTTLDLIATGTY